MLKIRFQRTGRKNDPAFRIVVAEHTASAKAGKNVAVVGSHHPKTKHTIIDAEQVKKWLGHGAHASGTVHNLLVSKGIIEGKKVNVLGKKTPIVKEEEKKEEPKAAAPTAPTEEEVKADADTEDAPSETSNEETPAESEAGEEEKKEEVNE